MWMAEIGAVSFSGTAVLRFPRADALRAAVARAFQESAQADVAPRFEELWPRYAAARAAARWSDHRERPLEEFLREAMGVPTADVAAVESAIAERLGAELEWHPDALPALDFLRESGYSCALLLDLPLALPSTWLERAGKWFSVLVTTKDLGLRSPAPAVFSEVVRRFHVAPARVLHVGDGLAEDVYAAQRAGLRAALIERMAGHVPDPAAVAWLQRSEGRMPAETQPDLKVRTLQELAAAIDAFA